MWFIETTAIKLGVLFIVFSQNVNNEGYRASINELRSQITAQRTLFLCLLLSFVCHLSKILKSKVNILRDNMVYGEDNEQLFRIHECPLGYIHLFFVWLN